MLQYYFIHSLPTIYTIAFHITNYLSLKIGCMFVKHGKIDPNVLRPNLSAIGNVEAFVLGQ